MEPEGDMVHGMVELQPQVEIEDVKLKEGMEVQPAPPAPRRMIGDVLLEPTLEQKPVVRRRGRGKRRIGPKFGGTIPNYFSKLALTKDWIQEDKKESCDGNDLLVGQTELRKRKLEHGGNVDDEEQWRSSKVARTMMNTRNDDQANGTTSSGEVFTTMGAKSSLEREPDDDGWNGASNWEGIKGMRRQSLGESLGNKDTDRNHTNTQE